MAFQVKGRAGRRAAGNLWRTRPVCGKPSGGLVPLGFKPFIFMRFWHALDFIKNELPGRQPGGKLWPPACRGVTIGPMQEAANLDWPAFTLFHVEHIQLSRLSRCGCLEPDARCSTWNIAGSEEHSAGNLLPDLDNSSLRTRQVHRREPLESVPRCAFHSS